MSFYSKYNSRIQCCDLWDKCVLHSIVNSSWRKHDRDTNFEKPVERDSSDFDFKIMTCPKQATASTNHNTQQ